MKTMKGAGIIAILALSTMLVACSNSDLYIISAQTNTTNNTDYGPAINSLNTTINTVGTITQTKASTGYSGYCQYGIAGITSTNNSAPNVTCASAPTSSGNLSGTYSGLLYNVAVFNGISTVISTSFTANPTTGDVVMCSNAAADCAFYLNSTLGPGFYYLRSGNRMRMQAGPTGRLDTDENYKYYDNAATTITTDLYSDVADREFLITNPGAKGGNLRVDNNVTVGSILTTPQICLNGDCRTAWPTSSAGGNTSVAIAPPSSFFTLWEEFTHNTGTQAFGYLGGAAVSAGTASNAAGNKNGIGLATISDSTTAGGGYFMRTNTGLLLIYGGEEGLFRANFNPAAKAGRTTGYMGFIDTSTAAQSTDGCYFRVIADNNGSRALGECANNSVRTNTSTEYRYTNGTFYVFNVSITGAGTPASTYANFTITNGTGTVLWTSNVSYNIPLATGRETGFGIIATQDTTDAASIIATIDYAYLNVWRRMDRY